MSENKTAPVVKRNNIEKALTEMVFGKTSDNAGKKFWAPVIDVTNADDLAWAVADNLSGMVNKQLRLIFAEIYTDAVKDNTNEATGILDQAGYDAQLAADWQDFTAGVAKLSDLEENIGLLQDQIGAIINNPEFQLDDEGNKSPAMLALEGEVLALNKRITPLRKQYKAISEVYKERAAKRKDKAAKSPTATPAPASVQG